MTTEQIRHTNPERFTSVTITVVAHADLIFTPHQESGSATETK